MKSKTQRALGLVAQGLTPYAAAKKIGIATTTVYKAIAAAERKRTRPVCPTCGHPLKGS